MHENQFPDLFTVFWPSDSDSCPCLFALSLLLCRCPSARLFFVFFWQFHLPLSDCFKCHMHMQWLLQPVIVLCVKRPKYFGAIPLESLFYLCKWSSSLYRNSKTNMIQSRSFVLCAPLFIDDKRLDCSISQWFKSLLLVWKVNRPRPEDTERTSDAPCE